MNPTNSAAALSQLQGFQKTMQSPDKLLASQEQSLGVPQAQQQVSGLRQAITNTTNLLNQVAPSVYGRTGQSLVTSAQAGRQIANEQAPIQQNLSGLGQDYGNASGDLNTLLGRSQSLASLQEQGQQDRLSALQGIYQNLFGKEQAQLSNELERKKLAETIRQANMSNARASSSSNSGIDVSSLIKAISGGGTATAPKYLGNNDFRGALAYEAKHGNKDAALALKYSGNDQRYDGLVNSKAEYDALKRIGIKGTYTYRAPGGGIYL